MKKFFLFVLISSCLNGYLLLGYPGNPDLIKIKDYTISQFYLKLYDFQSVIFTCIDETGIIVLCNQTNRNSIYQPEMDLQKGAEGKSAFINKNQSPKNTGRALMESSIFMAVSAALYWWRWGLWAEDWQYSFTWEEQRIRFFTLEATKFDSNSFMTNFSHGPNGAIFYNFARTNNLTVGESYLFAITSSLFWEYVVEYKEIVSINDNLFNSFLGFSMGEPLYQLGKYLSHREETFSKVLAVIVNPILALNNWLDGKNRVKDSSLLSLYQLESHLLFGPIQGDFSGTTPGYNYFNIGFKSSLISIPGYKQSGKSQKKLKTTFFSEIFADMTLGPKYIEEFNIITKATLFGFFKKNLKKKHNRLKGYQFFLALGSAFDMFRKTSKAPYDTITSGSSHSEYIEVTRPTDFSDKMAIINTFGPMLEFTLFLAQTKLKLTIESYFDFALVNSFALTEYSKENPLYDTKSALGKYGYYYAYGFTTASSLTIQRGNFHLEGMVKYQQFDSIEGLDRFQNSILDDFHITDSRLVYQIGLGYQIPHTPITLLLSYQELDREGTIKDINHHEIENKIYFQIKLPLI